MAVVVVAAAVLVEGLPTPPSGNAVERSPHHHTLGPLEGQAYPHTNPPRVNANRTRLGGTEISHVNIFLSTRILMHW